MSPLFAAMTARIVPQLPGAAGEGMQKLLAGDGAVGHLPEHHAALPFQEVLAALQPFARVPLVTAQDDAGLAHSAAVHDDAITTLTDSIGELLATLVAKPGAFEPEMAEAAFVSLLQGYDLETGGNATALFAETMGQLDPECIAQLDEATSQDPVPMFAMLCRLADIPGDQFGEQASDHGVSVARHVLRSPQESLPQNVTVPSKPMIFDLTTRRVEKGLQDAGIGQQPSAAPLPGPAPALVDLRAVIANVLATNRAGPDREAVLLAQTPIDTRPLADTAHHAARPVAAPQPPASGFARNLAQQIRSATFTDGHTRIALAPRGLGEIEIDMRPDEAGRLRIILRAENPAVLQALRGDRDGLLLALSDGGAGVDDADLEFEDFSRRQRGGAERPDALPRHRADTDDEDTPHIAAPTSRSTGPGALDILT